MEEDVAGRRPPKDDHVLENSYVKVTFDPETNRLQSIFNKETGQNMSIDQLFFW